MFVFRNGQFNIQTRTAEISLSFICIRNLKTDNSYIELKAVTSSALHSLPSVFIPLFLKYCTLAAYRIPARAASTSVLPSFFSRVAQFFFFFYVVFRPLPPFWPWLRFHSDLQLEGKIFLNKEKGIKRSEGQNSDCEAKQWDKCCFKRREQPDLSAN